MLNIQKQLIKTFLLHSNQVIHHFVQTANIVTDINV